MKGKKIIIIGLKIFSIVLVIFIVGYWLNCWFMSVYPSFLSNREEIGEFSPMIKEAKRLKLNYKQVVSNQNKFKGKHVIWCVQSKENGEAFYKGDLNKRLFVTNYQWIPVFGGSKHSSCADMLLKIEQERKTSLSIKVVDVEFLHKLE
ncbi:MAG: hypothetical protein KAR84_04830 [Elusimicrobiales bacterium]|nr:hypothetical protein [Elusimicrobiales bacterium]